MQTQVIWKGIYYQSLEHCTVSFGDAGNEISSTIIGEHEGQLYKVEYQIRTNARWEVLYVHLSAQMNAVTHIWEPSLEGLVFIDISLTPFTNTLPVNSLQLGVGERRVIDLIYIDVLENEIKRTQQVYERLTNSEYLFETIDGSFRAVIRVNEQGLVVDYPGLFSLLGSHT